MTSRVHGPRTFRLCWLACGYGHPWGWRGGTYTQRLSAGWKVVWVTDLAQAVAELADLDPVLGSAAASGQMAVVSSSGRLHRDAGFVAQQAVGWVSGQVMACREDGFPGLRLALDTSWALRPVSGVEQLPDFEKGMVAVMAGSNVSVLCQYDRERFDPVTLASITASHTHSVAAATYYAGRPAADLPPICAIRDPACR